MINLCPYKCSVFLSLMVLELIRNGKEKLASQYSNIEIATLFKTWSLRVV